MADPRFFARHGPLTLGRLAEVSGAEPAPGAPVDQAFLDVAPLDQAGAADFTFLENPKYRGALVSSQAGGCVLRPAMAAMAPPGMALLLSSDPYRAYARIAAAFYPSPPPEPGIAPSAVVDPSAMIGEGCRIEAGAVVGQRVEIGRRTLVGANAVIGDGVLIGADCIIGANASVSHSIIGDRVELYPGVRVGQDGFGFAMGREGYLKVPQLGRVIIHDDVEIGANTTIDRGAGPDTVIGAGCRIDNLVQIGHNVRLGRGCVIVAQAGISGSTHLADFVAVGGQAGITGHLRIGAGARIAGKSGVMRDVAPGAEVGGTPALPMKEWLRVSAILARMAGKKGNA